MNNNKFIGLHPGGVQGPSIFAGVRGGRRSHLSRLLEGPGGGAKGPCITVLQRSVLRTQLAIGTVIVTIIPVLPYLGVGVPGGRGARRAGIVDYCH